MKKLLYLILVCFAINQTTIAQPPKPIVVKKSNKEQKGDKYAFVYSFDKAIKSYSESKSLTPEGQRQLSNCYYNTYKYKEAQDVYCKLVVNHAGDALPKDYYNYAMILKSNGKYEESSIWMEKYKETNPYNLSVKSYADNNFHLNSLLTESGKYKIEHLNINSDAEDFGTSFYKDKLVFSSSRTPLEANEKKYNWTGKPFLDIYSAQIVEGNQLKTPENFNISMNGKMHDGTASFNSDGTQMAYSSNVYGLAKKENVVGLEISFSNYADGKWSTPISFILNSKDYSVGQPFLSLDGNTMYFAGNMPGGFGGVDIYKITKDETGTWKDLKNMGNTINTEGDELFPFFDEQNEILFFTSNGHYGLGGLDIFMCATNGKEFGKVYNAGTPLNTQYDDFALIVNSKTNIGYFSSDRIGGSGCDDIYSVQFLKGLNAGKKIIGIAKNIAGIAIPNTFVSLLDGNGKVIDTTTTKNDASYFFFVDSDKNFELKGKKHNYLDGDTLVNTYGNSFIINADLVLQQPPKKEEIIAKKIVVGADLGKILELKPIYFDLNKYDIRPDAEIELDKIVKIMTDYPNMIIELGAHTDCSNSKAYNQKLSNRRAKASAAYVQRGITSAGRVFGKGYGETKLVNNCACEGKVKSKCSEEEQQNNRRTEFIILKK